MNKLIKIFLVCFFLSCSLENECKASKILAILPVESKSHFLMYGTILEALAERGHEITIANPFPESATKYKKMKYIDLTIPIEMPMFTLEYLKDLTPHDNVLDIIDYSVEVCQHAVNKSTILPVLQEKYDLFITEVFGCDCFLPYGHKLNVPTIGLISSVTLPWTTPMLGHFENPSYVPSYFLPYTQKMTFYQRFWNTIFNINSHIRYELTSNRKIQKYVNEALGPMPPLRYLANNISLILANSHFSVNQVKPNPPQLIEVGGLHIPTTVNPIPKDLEDFYKESKHGVVLFSLGSYAPAETFSENIMEAILDTFGGLKLNILWKINATGLTKTLPPNVQTSLWVPQLSVLCDPRTKLFIAHGGLLGVQEAMYCGVPVLGIPLFADQFMNLKSIQEKGAGLMIYYDDINKETFSSSVQKLIEDQSYRENAKRVSKIFKDRPQHPLELAVYWIEYVLRHNGAPHLKSPSLDLAWYQYLLLDVAAIVIAILITSIYLIRKIVRMLLSAYKSSKKDSAVSKEKKKR